MKKDSILYVVIFTFVVCAAFVFLLALANEATKDQVAANRLFMEQAAVLDAFGIPYASPQEALNSIRKRSATRRCRMEPVRRKRTGTMLTAKPSLRRGLRAPAYGVPSPSSWPPTRRRPGFPASRSSPRTRLRAWAAA